MSKLRDDNLYFSHDAYIVSQKSSLSLGYLEDSFAQFSSTKDLAVAMFPSSRSNSDGYGKPSIKQSWVRKLTSRCLSYEADFELFSLLYDISLARQLTAVIAIAEREKIAPEQAASTMQNFDSFWEKEKEKLEDMCRQKNCFPNLFFTVAPAEWKFNWHRGVQQWQKGNWLLGVRCSGHNGNPYAPRHRHDPERDNLEEGKGSRHRKIQTTICSRHRRDT